MYNQTQFVQKFLNNSFNQIPLFFFCSFISFFYNFQTFFIVLNIFLHLTHIYANSFNSSFFTYLKMTEDRSKRLFFIRYSQKASNITMNAIQMSSGLRRDLCVLALFPLSSFKNCSDQILPAFSFTITSSCQNNHYFLVYPLGCLLNFAEKLLTFEMFASNHEANQAKRSKLSRRRNFSSADLVLKIRVNVLKALLLLWSPHKKLQAYLVR